jgi:nitronate monooxygenase
MVPTRPGPVTDTEEEAMLQTLEVPIVQAPMAGGPSTPALAAAVSGAGALGFVAAGYRSAAAMADDIAAVRGATDRPFGVNVFAPPTRPADAAAVEAYRRLLAPEAERAGAALGAPRFDDDDYEAKITRLLEAPVAVVSFTFGCPAAETVGALRAAGSEVWVTVTDVAEAEEAAAAGATALVVQGSEAGGHRGSFADRDDRVDSGLLALLQLVADRVALPLVATGGIATGAAVAAVLAAGAAAAQVGTAFMLCPEAGTSAAHREQVASERPTGLTRAFSGRLARGIVNRMQAERSADAPIAYPEVHHVTAPLRARARERGDADLINLWAGEAHALAEARPAAEVVARLDRDAREALSRAQRRLGGATAAQKAATCYAIAELDVTDPTWVRGYVDAVTTLVERAGGRYLARTPDITQLEGEDARPQVVVLIEWPSREAARAFYDSPAYAPYRADRIRGARNRFLLVAGEDVNRVARIPR